MRPCKQLFLVFVCLFFLTNAHASQIKIVKARNGGSHTTFVHRGSQDQQKESLL